MKKLLSITLAIVLTLSLSVMAFADNGISGDGKVVVTYKTDESYVVTIPAKQDITSAATTGEVKATNVLLADKTKLVVSMTSANDYKLDCAGSKIAYTVKAGSTTFTSTVKDVLTVTSGDTSGTTTLTFQTADGAVSNATKAGDHTDTLTFTCAVTDIT